jgi:hypothetical protein
MGGWESLEVVQRNAHLALNHLTEHARLIDAIFGGLVPNLSHVEIEKLGSLQDSNILVINMFYMDKIVFDKIYTNIYTNR